MSVCAPHRWIVWGHAVTLIMLGALLAIAVAPQFSSTAPPVLPHSQQFLEAKARAGDVVTLRVDRTRVRYCPGIVDEFWRDDALPNRIVQGRRRPASPDRALGHFITDIPKTIPAELTPGRWCYSPVIRHDCADGPHYPTWMPACIEIIP